MLIVIKSVLSTKKKSHKECLNIVLLQAAFPSERLGMGAFRIALESVFNRYLLKFYSTVPLYSVVCIYLLNKYGILRSLFSEFMTNL